MRILITSGGTKIPIDRVRHIQNMSSGTFGSEIARYALANGCMVDFLTADKGKTPFKIEVDAMTRVSGETSHILAAVAKVLDFHTQHSCQYKEFTYNSFDSYASQLETLLKATRYDAVILAAAVSDYGVENYVDGKVRSKDSDFNIKLMKLPKLISRVREWSNDHNTTLIGFKLLVDSTEAELIAAAKNSIKDNKCDGIIANDLRDIKAGNHSIRTVTADEDEYYAGATRELAERVIEFTRLIVHKKQDEESQ